MNIVRELVALLVDTFWPRCLICGRRKWSASADLACRYRPKSYADEALRSDGP